MKLQLLTICTLIAQAAVISLTATTAQADFFGDVKAKNEELASVAGQNYIVGADEVAQYVKAGLSYNSLHRCQVTITNAPSGYVLNVVDGTQGSIEPVTVSVPIDRSGLIHRQPEDPTQYALLYADSLDTKKERKTLTLTFWHDSKNNPFVTMIIETQVYRHWADDRTGWISKDAFLNQLAGNTVSCTLTAGMP